MNRIWNMWVIAVLMVVAFCASSAAQNSDQVQKLYAQAKAQEQDGHLDLAIETYQQIIHLQAGLAAAYNNLGSLYYRTMRLDDAIVTLKHACELEPALAAPKALLGLAYYQRGSFEEARRQLALAGKISPGDPNVKLYLARSMIQMGDLKDAKAVLEQLQAQQPDNEEALYTLGSLYSVLAESAFGHIQETAPNSYLLELLLGKAAEARQIYADAAEHYKNAIERAPGVPELYYHYAHALALSGKQQEAVSTYKRALELNPYDYQSASEEAGLIVEQDPQQALELANRSLQLHPDNDAALVVRARASIALNAPSEAVVDLKKANALNPDNEAVHFQLARAYRKLGQKEQARAEDSIYEQLLKEDSEATLQRSQKHLNQNDSASGSVPANQPPQ